MSWSWTGWSLWLFNEKTFVCSRKLSTTFFPKYEKFSPERSKWVKSVICLSLNAGGLRCPEIALGEARASLFIQNFWWLPTGADEPRLSLLRLVVQTARRAVIGPDSSLCPVVATGDRPWPRGSLTNRDPGVSGWMQSWCVSQWGGRVWTEHDTTSFPQWPPELQHGTHLTALWDLPGDNTWNYQHLSTVLSSTLSLQTERTQHQGSGSGSERKRATWTISKLQPELRDSSVTCANHIRQLQSCLQTTLSSPTPASQRTTWRCSGTCTTQPWRRSPWTRGPGCSSRYLRWTMGESRFFPVASLQIIVNL